MTRNLLAMVFLLARCEAGTLRRNDEGFEVVGGSPIRDADEFDHPRRELVFIEEDFVDEFTEDMFNDEDVIIQELMEENIGAAKEILEDTRKYVSSKFSLCEIYDHDWYANSLTNGHINPDVSHDRSTQNQVAATNPQHVLLPNSHFNLPSKQMDMDLKLPTN